MRIALRIALCQSDRLHDLSYPFLILCFIFAYLKVLQRLSNQILYIFSRIQRSRRVLENHLHLFADFRQLFALIVRNILAVINNLSSGRLM